MFANIAMQPIGQDPMMDQVSGQGEVSQQVMKQMAPQAFMITGSPQTIFIGDIPRNITLVEFYEQVKKISNSTAGDELQIVLKRPAMRFFAYAFCRFPDILQARKLSEDIRYHEFAGQMCRILPFDKELLKKAEQGSNLFVKGLKSEWNHKQLFELFKQYGEIISCRVSIKENFESRKYGFVLFHRADAA